MEPGIRDQGAVGVCDFARAVTFGPTQAPSPMIRLTSFLIVSLVAISAAAQSPPSPEQFLGYELGERFTPHHRVIDYFQAVASTSDRVHLQPYGETYEGRPLMVAFVGQPSVVSDLEEVRVNNLRRTGIESGEVEDGPAIVWLSYNVHGNESVSTEASMATLYELVRPGNARVDAWLSETLVVIDPCLNPDGRERYVNWYNQTVGFKANANPDAREHREPWPGGRTNHYHFDLNRDWAWQTQQESQQRLRLFNSWLPHVHVDFHEQGVDSPYYFAPAAEPYHLAITDWQRALQDSIGSNHARYFDENGWLYFTREVFDLFYPGYGDTYPTFNGGVGMTYEQGGSGRAGLAIETAEGDTLTLGDRILHHHTTGLSTIEAAARQSDRVLEEFAAFYARAQEVGSGAYSTFVFKASSGEERLRALAGHLDQLGITYGTVSESVRGVEGLNYRSGAMERVEAQPGDLVVSTRQPKGVLTRVMLEPDPELPDSVTYDITSWALPYAYGLDAFAIEADMEPDKVFPEATGPVLAAAEPYAWALRWDSPADARLLAMALQAGANARVATEPFVSSGETWPAGTVLFTRAGNEALGDGLESVLREAVESTAVGLVPLASGRVEAGSDFGSGSVRFISAPRVVVATGEGVSSSSAGEIWHWFEQTLGYLVTMVNADDLGRLDLGEYDVLVLPSGSFRGLVSGDGLMDWIRAGGRVVAVDGALSSFAGVEGFGLTSVEGEEDEDDGEDLLRTYSDRRREGVKDDIPGAVFRTRVDASHPLGFGLERGYFTLRRSTRDYAYLEQGWNVGVLEKGARLSGQVGVDARPSVEDVLAFGTEEIGRGSVVYLADNPVYRGFWYEGQLLLANAVFMPLR